MLTLEIETSAQQDIDVNMLLNRRRCDVIMTSHLRQYDVITKSDMSRAKCMCRLKLMPSLIRAITQSQSNDSTLPRTVPWKIRCYFGYEGFFVKDDQWFHLSIFILEEQNIRAPDASQKTMTPLDETRDFCQMSLLSFV